MVIVKFALIFFLIFTTLALVQSQGQGPLQGGPFYYLEMPGCRNPVQPKYHLNGWNAFHRRNVWRIWFDDKGRPVDMRLYHDGQEAHRTQLFWDKNGHLWNRKDSVFGV
jgi:hypothetical protein